MTLITITIIIITIINKWEQYFIHPKHISKIHSHNLPHSFPIWIQNLSNLTRNQLYDLNVYMLFVTWIISMRKLHSHRRLRSLYFLAGVMWGRVRCWTNWCNLRWLLWVKDRVKLNNCYFVRLARIKYRICKWSNLRYFLLMRLAMVLLQVFQNLR